MVRPSMGLFVRKYRFVPQIVPDTRRQETHSLDKHFAFRMESQETPLSISGTFYFFRPGNLRVDLSV